MKIPIYFENVPRTRENFYDLCVSYVKYHNLNNIEYKLKNDSLPIVYVTNYVPRAYVSPMSYQFTDEDYDRVLNSYKRDYERIEND